MRMTTLTTRDQREDEISHSTAASSENKGLDKMVPKDPCGSDTSKHEKRARVRMQVIGRTWASSEKIYGAKSRGPSRPGDWYKGWFEIGAPTVNVHTVSSSLPMTVVLGQDQHTVDYVMNTDINWDLKVWLKMTCSNHWTSLGSDDPLFKMYGVTPFPHPNAVKRHRASTFSGWKAAYDSTSWNSYHEHFHLQGLLEGKLNSGGS